MSEAHVYKAICKVQAAVAKEGIAKERKNEQQGYKFRGIDDVYNALSAHLADAELCILPRLLNRTVTERATQRGGILFYVCVDVEFDFVSAKDGTKHVVKIAGEAMDSGDKATNKAMSAAYKYACMQAFCIPTEGDNDADATTHTPVAGNVKKPKGTAEPIPADDLPDSFFNKPNPLIARLKNAIDGEDWLSVGEHIITTRGTIEGLTVKEAVDRFGKQISKHFGRYKGDDRLALAAYMKAMNVDTGDITLDEVPNES